MFVLFEPGRAAGSSSGGKEGYFRRVAVRAGMDYLSHAPLSAETELPDSFDSIDHRAGCVTDVLNNILHHPPSRPPPAY